ncbi:hypothetical protein KJZ99_01770 [bacterium]|nr:hypothetical protein [bacterium]
MIQTTTRTKLLWLILLGLLAAAILMYLMFARGAEYSAEALQNQRAELKRHDLTLISRGREFACYDVALTTMQNDTVRTLYRLPATERRIKAVILVYDAPQDVDVRALLDDIPEARHAAVMSYNTSVNFVKDRDGKPSTATNDYWQGLSKTRRGLDVIFQFLRKHHVVDSSQIYIAGAGWANSPMLAALAGLPYHRAGIALIDYTQGVEDWKESAPSRFSAPQKWLRDAAMGKVAYVESGAPQVSNKKLYTVDGEHIALSEAYASTNDQSLKKGASAVLRWVVGDDVILETKPGIPDSVYTRAVNIDS